MPRLTDLTTVRAILNRDREWAAYAIGDLSAGFIEHCEWHAPGDGQPALLLVYRGFDPPITFAMGQVTDLRPLFHEISAAEISLHVRPDAVEAMAAAYKTTATRAMRRMVLRHRAFTPAPDDDVAILDENDLAAVSTLYEEGHRRGEGPTFFNASMLRQQTFRGVWEGGALVAVAGSHLYSPEESVCAIGNVYTRSDCRGRGLAARVTSAVAAHALRDGVATIVLNVGQDNDAARRVYQRLGFASYGDFLEGAATRIARQ
jgi:ribosomal protein S18 acetylase RimI-like enzyme